MFIESEWLKLLFLLGDMQTWIGKTEKDLFRKVPGSDKKRFFCKTYYLTAADFAHIIERHYHKIPRHMDAGKFTVPVPDILNCIRSAASQVPVELKGTLNFYREFDTGKEIGFDRAGVATTMITVITTPGGAIRTAFPGKMNDLPATSPQL